MRPLSQTCPLPQRLLQPPQLLRSKVMSTHLPLHSLWCPVS